jgi:hypothetical protein
MAMAADNAAPGRQKIRRIFRLDIENSPRTVLSLSNFDHLRDVLERGF